MTAREALEQRAGACSERSVSVQWFSRPSKSGRGTSPSPVYLNKNGLVLHMSSALIGACLHRHTDKKRTMAASQDVLR